MNRVEYRKEAADAQHMAVQAASTAEKAAWLCVAQGWISLLKQRRGIGADALNRDAKRRKQKASSSSRRAAGKPKLSRRAGRGAMRRSKA